jgi:hypothetical protein
MAQFLPHRVFACKKTEINPAKTGGEKFVHRRLKAVHFLKNANHLASREAAV